MKKYEAESVADLISNLLLESHHITAIAVAFVNGPVDGGDVISTYFGGQIVALGLAHNLVSTIQQDFDEQTYED